MLSLAHKNLDVWKESLELVKQVYFITDKLPKKEDFVIVSQMRRAALSVPSNIAEGYSRASKKEITRFLEISRSSLVELDTQFELCVELNYLTKNELGKISELINKIFAKLTNLMKSLK
jgi:four helix bundle protein